VKPGLFAILWRYQVADEHRDQFERAYAPAGDWARLFGTADGYIRTDLMAADGGQYVTIDYWRSEEDFHAFQAQSGAEYMALDERCGAWTLSEERIGEFTMVEEETG
jgi:heme-degrading monooxygenase HmoA